MVPGECHGNQLSGPRESVILLNWGRLSLFQVSCGFRCRSISYDGTLLMPACSQKASHIHIISLRQSEMRWILNFDSYDLMWRPEEFSLRLEKRSLSCCGRATGIPNSFPATFSSKRNTPTDRSLVCVFFILRLEKGNLARKQM